MPKLDYSIFIAAVGVQGLGAYAYSKLTVDAKDKTALPRGYTILGPDTIKTLMDKWKVVTVADLLAAMDIENGITEIDG